MRFSLIVIVPVLASGCLKKEQFDDVKVIGHAGSGLQSTTSLYHDNTYEAVHYALGMEGIAGTEVDVQCSASQTAWLFHDPQLEKETNGGGCVNSVTDDYLASLHYTTAEHEDLVRLADIGFPFSERELLLDVRSANECLGQEVDQQFVIEAIRQALPQGFLPVVITNNAEWVHAFFLEGWKVYYEVSETPAYLNSACFAETAGICIRNTYMARDEVEAVHAVGKEVVIFEVRSGKSIRSALKKHPDYLITDDLKATLIEKYR